MRKGARIARFSRHVIAGNRQRGTTLIELLIVIGIIALLISMLVPSLKRTMSLAASTVCMHNLREIGHGLTMYRYDNDGWVPTSFGDAEEESVTASAQSEAWFHRLYPTYIAEPQAMTCPEDPYRFRLLEAPGGLANPQAGDFASYGLNSFILNADGGRLADLDRHRPTRPLDTILVADLGPDSIREIRSASGHTLSKGGPLRKGSLLAWGDGYNPLALQMTEPWVTRRHGHGINMLTLGGGVRSAGTEQVMRNPVRALYTDCEAGGCTLCNNGQSYRPLILHYSFARDQLYWWTGPLPGD